MSLEPHLAALVLLAALAHASWNAIVKTSGDRLFTLTTVVGLGSVLYLPALFVLDVPPPAAWPWLITSTVLHLGYFAALAWAYRHGDLSAVYPISRGSSPVLVGIGAALFAGQVLSPGATAGVLSVSAGISLFAFERGIPRGDLLKPVGIALLVGLLIASYTVVDGIGLRRTPDPFSYIAWLFVLDVVPLVTYVLAFRAAGYARHLRRHWRPEMIGGFFTFLAYSLVLYVLSTSGMAFVSALRETSVLFAVIIGAVRLKERFGVVRWAAALLVVAGVVTMNVAG